VYFDKVDLVQVALVSANYFRSTLPLWQVVSASGDRDLTDFPQKLVKNGTARQLLFNTVANELAARIGVLIDGFDRVNHSGGRYRKRIATFFV
jgi:hypothetical protein